jgi:hypothetical protein
VYVLFGVKRWNTLVCQSILVFVYVSDAIVCTGKREGGSTPASASCNIFSLSGILARYKKYQDGNIVILISDNM